MSCTTSKRLTKFLQTRRGFVGPLGDDIPSIFPIVAGIMLFLGTIAYASDLVNEKSSYLEIRKAAMGLSYIVTEKGLTNAALFDQKCDSMQSYASANSVKFLVTLKRFCNAVNLYEPTDADSVSPYFVIPSDALDATWLSCYEDDPVDDSIQKAIDTSQVFSPPLPYCSPLS